jgi:hypothetical protein
MTKPMKKITITIKISLIVLALVACGTRDVTVQPKSPEEILSYITACIENNQNIRPKLVYGYEKMERDMRDFSDREREMLIQMANKSKNEFGNPIVQIDNTDGKEITEKLNQIGLKPSLNITKVIKFKYALKEGNKTQSNILEVYLGELDGIWYIPAYQKRQ